MRGRRKQRQQSLFFHPPPPPSLESFRRLERSALAFFLLSFSQALLLSLFCKKIDRILSERQKRREERDTGKFVGRIQIFF